METLNVQPKLEPIVNGSVNSDLTLPLMLEFDYKTKQTMAWFLICSINSISQYRHVASEVFYKSEVKYTYDMITPESVDEVLTNMKQELDRKTSSLKVLTNSLHYKQGKEIFEARKNLGFGGFLEMNAAKMVGYVHAVGSWNEYDHMSIGAAIQTLETHIPVFYMPNNPNNGMKRHKWATNGDYITIKCDYLGKGDRAEYLEFYKEIFQPMAKRIKADSCRYEIIEHEYDACSLEMIYWWD